MMVLLSPISEIKISKNIFEKRCKSRGCPSELAVSFMDYLRPSVAACGVLIQAQFFVQDDFGKLIVGIIWCFSGFGAHVSGFRA